MMFTIYGHQGLETRRAESIKVWCCDILSSNDVETRSNELETPPLSNSDACAGFGLWGIKRRVAPRTSFNIEVGFIPALTILNDFLVEETN